MMSIVRNQVRNTFLACGILLLIATSALAQSPADCTERLDQLITYLDQISIANQDSALSLAHDMIHEASACDDDTMYALAHLYVADIFFNQAYLEDAFDHYDSAYIHYKAMQDSAGIMQAMMGLGNVYTELGEVEEAMNAYLRLLDYYSMHQDTPNIALCHYNISLIFMDQNNMQAAKIKLQQTLRLMQQYQGADKRLQGDAMQMLGHMLYQEGNNDSARLLMIQSLSMVDTSQNPEFVHYAYINFALIDKEKKNFNSALIYTQKAIDIVHRLNDQSALSSYYTILSGIMLARNEMSEALRFADTALFYATETASLNLLIKAHDGLASVYKKMGDFEKAYWHLDTTRLLDDSIRAFDAETRLMTYEKDVREQETERLRQESISTDNMRLAQQRIIRERSLAAIIIAFLSIILLIALIRMYGLHQRGKKLHAAKDTILSVISHDLRGPIVQMESLTRMQRQALPEDVQQEVTKNLALASSNLANAFDNILYWSKSQMQGLQAKHERVDLRPNLSEAIEFHEVFARTKNIEVSMIAENNLCHTCDPVHLQIIIRNLLGNAIKYSHKGSTVTVQAAVRDGQLEISVQDTGVGISPEKLQKLLRKQVDFSTIGTRNELGTGLGFQLVRQFAAANNFNISIESAENVGTTVTLSAPACKASLLA